MTKYDEDEELVVKVCDTNDIGMYNSAFNEYQILKKLNCQYTSQFVAFYEDPLMNKTYLVMKNAGTNNLTQFINERRTDKSRVGGQKPLSEALIKSIMKVLFQTIEYLHRNKICHRDLKPDNILVNTEL